MASTFDPNAWLAKNSAPAAKADPQTGGFDPHAWLAKESGSKAQVNSIPEDYANDDFAKAYVQKNPQLLADPEGLKSNIENARASKNYAQPVAHAALKALTYLNGIKNTGLATVASAGKQAVLAGKEAINGVGNPWQTLGKNVVTEEEAKNAINPLSSGISPSLAEYAERLGIPKGGSISDVAPMLFSAPGSGGVSKWHLPERGGPMDWTTRGVGSTLIDAASDPINPILAAHGLNGVGNAMEAGGKGMYRSGLKAADIAAENMGKGKHAASDLFFEHGVTGTPTKFAKASNDISDELLQHRGDLYDIAHSQGARPDMAVAMAEAKEKIKELIMNHDPAHREVIPALQEQLEKYGVSSPIDLHGESGWKSSLYDTVPQSKWANTTSTNAGEGFRKTMARGLKEDIENQANKVQPGLGDSIADTNADLGTLLSTQKTLGQEAAKAVKKNAITSVDPMVFALGHASGIGVPALALKKGADVMKSTWARTTGGKALYDLGAQQGLPVDALLRNQNVWQNLLNQNQGDKR